MNINENKGTSATQCELILDYLQDGNTLTSLEALKMFGCMRLASRIHDLRDRGYDIKNETIKVNSGKRVTRYWI